MEPEQSELGLEEVILKSPRGGLPGDPVVETELPLEGHRFDPWSDPTCRGVQPINK